MLLLCQGASYQPGLSTLHLDKKHLQKRHRILDVTVYQVGSQLITSVQREGVKPWSQRWLIAAGAYPGFCSMKRLEVFLLPLDGMLVHCRPLPRNFLGFSQQFAGTHLYTWEDRGTVGVSCPRTKHNVPGQGSNPDRSLRSRAH